MVILHVEGIGLPRLITLDHDGPTTEDISVNGDDLPLKKWDGGKPDY